MRKSLFLLAAGLLLAGRLAAEPVPASPAVPPAAQPAPAPGAAPAAEASAKQDIMLFPRTAAPIGPSRSSSPVGGATLTLLVALFGAAAGWLLWRRLRGVRDSGRGHQLAIAETRSLGNRQFLVIAAYGDRKFLLGVCPGRIDMLSALEEGRPPPL